MTESEIQARLIALIRGVGIVALKLEPGTGNIPKGWPDLCLLYPGGDVVWVEVKAAGGRVSPQQRRHMLMLEAAGHRVCFYDEGRKSLIPMTEEEIREYRPPSRT